MKKIFLIILIMGTVTGSLFSLKVLAADNSYAVLAPLPGVADVVGGKTTLETYIPAIFKLAIGLSAVAAVLMIVIGGFQYITSDAIMKKDEGRKRIENAIWGLVLVIVAWLILNTINPNLMSINLNIDQATTGPIDATGTLSSSAWVNLTPEQITQSKTTRDLLTKEGILTYASACTTQGVSTGCVNLNGLKSTTISGVEELSTELGCSDANKCIKITGGTEAGHTGGDSHANGSALDFQEINSMNKITNYLANAKGATTVNTAFGPQVTVTMKNGQSATFLYETGSTIGSTGDHWHVTFH